MLLQSRIETVNATIEQIQEQLAALQQKLTDLQGFSQQLLSVDQAADSALSQLQSAVSLINAVCPEELETFRIGINAILDPNPLRLSAVDDDLGTQATDTNPVEPDTDGITTVEAQTVGNTDTVDDQPGNTTETPTDNDNGNGKAGNHAYSLLATVEDLRKCDRPVLIKLANKHQIPGYQNKTRDKLADSLVGKVTVDEITPALNGKGKK